MHKIQLAGIFIFLFQLYYTQVYKPISFPKELPPQYLVNAEQEYDSLLKKNYAGEKEYNIQRYAEAMVYQKRERLKSGSIYIGWEEGENYLNSVVQKILPEDLKNKNIKTYLVKSSSLNAFTIYDGSIFVNVGLIAEIENEASLAIILAHELAHFINSDVENGFFDQLKINKVKSDKKQEELSIENLHEDRQRELDADLLGFELAMNAGYDLSNGISNFYKIKIEQEKNMAKNLEATEGIEEDDDEEEDEKSTHPKVEERVKALKKFIKSNKKKIEANASKNTSSNKEFYNLQKTSRLEVLSILLEIGNYRRCMEKSFYYHLFDSESDEILYFLVEANRRFFVQKTP